MSSFPPEQTRDFHSVGPVLRKNELAERVVAAIMKLNPEAKVVDRGAYLRVLVPLRCVLTRQAVEQQTGRPFSMPGQLEAIMPSFKGLLSIDEECATWQFHER
jgi:MmoB/DmpM family